MTASAQAIRMVPNLASLPRLNNITAEKDAKVVQGKYSQVDNPSTRPWPNGKPIKGTEVCMAAPKAYAM
jgi:hypothetical protein